jgi:NAD(P)-dependent dehydrogenase (short-subunit alcohol dehydrogenase family)
MSSRVAMVTGGAGEIGTAIALRLAAQGSEVVVADRDAAGAAGTAELVRERTGRPAHDLRVDVGDPESVREAVAWVDGTFGRLDQLVNNAGLNPRGGLETLPLPDWDAAMAVNVRGPLLLARHTTLLWKRNGGGRIVNITSRTVASGGPPAYTASKAGLVGLTRSLAVELGPLNVTVNAVAPSTVLTAFIRNRRTPEELAAFVERHTRMSLLGRLTTADDVAAAVAFLASDAAGAITGEVLHVCGGAQLAASPTTPAA